MENTEIQIEEMRARLNESRTSEFIDSLISDDEFATREHMIGLVSRGLQELLKVERKFMLEVLSEDGICPGCVMSNASDLIRVQTLCENFNNYLTAQGEHGDHDEQSNDGDNRTVAT